MSPRAIGSKGSNDIAFGNTIHRGSPNKDAELRRGYNPTNAPGSSHQSPTPGAFALLAPRYGHDFSQTRIHSELDGEQETAAAGAEESASEGHYQPLAISGGGLLPEKFRTQMESRLGHEDFRDVRVFNVEAPAIDRHTRAWTAGQTSFLLLENTARALRLGTHSLHMN